MLSSIVQVVYHWAKGMPFKDICELTDVLEGSIVRAIVRWTRPAESSGTPER